MTLNIQSRDIIIFITLLRLLRIIIPLINTINSITQFVRIIIIILKDYFFKIIILFVDNIKVKELYYNGAIYSISKILIYNSNFGGLY